MMGERTAVATLRMTSAPVLLTLVLLLLLLLMTYLSAPPTLSAQSADPVAGSLEGSAAARGPVVSVQPVLGVYYQQSGGR